MTIKKIRHHVLGHIISKARPLGLASDTTGNSTMDSASAVDESSRWELLKADLEDWYHDRRERVHYFCFSFVGYHYCYIISSSLVLSWILYPAKNMKYIDALYLAVSTCTNTGMGPIAGNKLHLYQQIFMLLFSILTHQLTINTAIVVFRIWLYEKQFDNIKSRSRMQSKARRVATKERKSTLKNRRDSEVQRHNAGEVARSLNLMQLRARLTRMPPQESFDLESPEPLAQDYDRTQGESVNGADDDNDDEYEEGEGPAIVVKSPMEIEHESGSTTGFAHPSRIRSLDEGEGPALVIRSPMDIEKEAEAAEQDGGIHFSELPRPRRSGTREDSQQQPQQSGRQSFNPALTRRSSLGKSRSMKGNYLSYAPTITGSTFVNLTQEQKDELGGVEYRALRILVLVLVCYYVGFLLLAWVTVAPWCQFRQVYHDQFTKEGSSPAWNGIFLGASAFLNFGFTLSPEGLTMFQQSAYVPLWTALFILAGNVAQPIILRFILWALFNMVPVEGAARESIGFLLDHPRRCFLLLFPSKPTWILLFVVISLNVVDVVIFLAIEFNSSFLRETPPGYRFLDGLYQAICLRTVGFNIFDISNVRPSVQLAYLVMMYVSIFPVAISVRNTNVYEEQTLGVWVDDEAQSVVTGVTSRTGNNQRGAKPVSTHLQRQLSHDMWYLAIGVFLICICEDKHIAAGEMSFLSILFEAVSAYSCVGVSTGFVGETYSLGGAFNVVSKLIVCALMIRGRHRGLPYKLDRAIMLKHKHLDAHDEIQEQRGRDLQSLMPTENDAQVNWLDRVNTNVSRLRRTATRVSASSQQSRDSKQNPSGGLRSRAKSFAA